jgi:hypothetical protein
MGTEVDAEHMNCAPMRFDRNFHLRIEDDFTDKLDDMRRLEVDVPPQSEMLRRIVNRTHASLVLEGLLPDPSTSKRTSAKKPTISRKSSKKSVS